MTWMIRRDPFGDVRNVQEELGRLFTSAVPRLFGDEEGLVRGSWNPSIDIFENADSIVLEADLPGVKPGDFELSVENNTLTLRGERKFEKETEGDNYHRVERSYGSFTRTFTLPIDCESGGCRRRIPRWRSESDHREARGDQTPSDSGCGKNRCGRLEVKSG